MNVIILCEGEMGDPSEKSQLKSSKVKISAPSLGKLPLPPIFSLQCNSKMIGSDYRGDFGSIFLLNCPKGCQNSPGSIWGTFVYTGDSSICRASIHSGIHDNNGGLLILVKLPGEKFSIYFIY